MSVKNHSDLSTEITTDITNNGAQLITGLILQGKLLDLADSAINVLGDSVQGKLVYSTILSITSNGDIPHKKYVDDAITSAVSGVLLADGSVPMTGNLDLGNNNVINVNLVKVNNGGGLYNLANNAHINLEADGHIDFTGTGIIATTVPYLDASKNLVSSSVTPAELGYLSGVTSAIQTQLNTKGSGSVTTASVVTANGISGTVANPTTTPAITLTLGAITPSSVNGVTLSGSATPTLAVTGTTTVSGTNTGDQTITLTGDITGSGTGSFATTIGANKVTYTKSYNGNQLSIVATMKLLTGN